MIYVTTSILLFLTSVSFTTWSIHILLQHKKQQYFVKRRPLLVGVTVISHCCVGLFGIQYVCILQMLQLLDTEQDNHNYDDTVQPLRFSSDIIGWIFETFALVSPTILLIRFWLLYFDMELSQLLKNQHWQMVINPNKLSNNWFLNPKNQRRFGGNGMFLFTLGMILCLVPRPCLITLDIYGFTRPSTIFTASVIFIEAKFCQIYI